jgi:hypothetical protein
VNARASAGAGLLALCWSIQAVAATSQVELGMGNCGELSESGLVEHLELELSTLGLSQVYARLQLRCEGTQVSVELRRASGERYPVQVQVELRDTARAARERLVALAASELIAQAERAPVTEDASRARPRAEPQPTPAVDAASHDAPKRARAARTPIELFIAGNAAYSGEPRAALWGGTLGTRFGLGRPWSVLLDTRLERGQNSLPLAEVRSTLLSGFVGAGASGGAGPLRLSAGIGVRAGWLALAATATPPNEGRSLTAPWAGVAAPLRLAFDVDGIAMPFVGAELGYVALPVRGMLDDGSVLLAQRGVWLSGSVGIALAL